MTISSFKTFQLGMTQQEFLSEYWQKKPCFFKSAYKGDLELISPEELAGLSVEDDIESRIVESREDNQYKFMQGPFTEETFEKLEKKVWTLLVQNVDKIEESTFHLRQHFRFIPDFRFDDIMVSYSEKGAGVGAHLDNYDVFLVQGRGRRKWQLEDFARTEEQEIYKPNQELRILENFKGSLSFIAEPGDILYIPPRFAHNGVSLEKAVTYSVGFRALSTQEIFQNHFEYIANKLPESDRYSDPDLHVSQHPAEINAESIDRMYKMLTSKVIQKEDIIEWFGKLNTEPSTLLSDNIGDKNLSISGVKEILQGQDSPDIKRDESIRVSFFHDKLHQKIKLFMNGELIEFSEKYLPLICFLTDDLEIDQKEIRSLFEDPSKEDEVKIIVELMQKGMLFLDDDLD